jgi:hypothetical protein
MRLLGHMSECAVSFAIASGISATLWSQGAPSARVLLRSTPDTVEVLKNGERVRVGRQKIKAVVRDGEHETFVNIVMLLEPSSGVHWWVYQHTRKSAENFDGFLLPPVVVYFTDQQAVAFTFAHTLGIRQVVGRHHDFAAVEKAVLADIGHHAKSVIAGNPSPHVIAVSVRNQLGDFLVKRNSGAAPSPPPEVVGVSRDENLWHVTLKGPNQDFAEVILNLHYDVTSVIRLPNR